MTLDDLLNSTVGSQDRRRFLSSLLKVSGGIAAPLMLGVPGFGQTATPRRPEARVEESKDAVFSTSVRVANILATVHDKNNKIVRDLKKEDFTLDEEGKPQEIRYFSQQSDLPLTIGMIVDVSGSQAEVIGKEKAASRDFLKSVLRPQDEGFVVSFGSKISLDQDLTSSRPDLDQAIANMELEITRPRFIQFQDDAAAHAQIPLNFQRGGGGRGGGGMGGGGIGMPPQMPGGAGRGRGGGGRGAGGGFTGTALFDAVFLAADEVLKPKEGRKAIVVLTDGEDVGSKVSLSTAIEAAQRADVLVYTLRFGSGGNLGGGPSGKAVLERMSDETGGAHFDSKRSLDKIFAEIEDELRSQYSLGFAPQGTQTGFRAITVKVKPKGYKVQTRAGYYVTNK
ncbi:MAG: VWA domain-containing protein [Acidobacteriota bacterium]